LRIGIDLNGKLSQEQKIKNKKAQTWIYSNQDSSTNENLKHIFVPDRNKLLDQICGNLYDAKHNTLLVEGGSRLLNSFIEAGLWDEARIIHTPKILKQGIKSPVIDGFSISKKKLHNDTIELLINPENLIYS